MKSCRTQSATFNTRATADIAFFLLIFFLVTTTSSADKAIFTRVPRICETEDCTKNISERNLLRININSEQAIMVHNEIVSVGEIEKLVKVFVDNNGSSKCDYCDGAQSQTASDHPQKEVISISYDALTKHDVFITVHDEITKAYDNLRTIYAMHTFNKVPEELS